ncbi:MAG: response regulator transcription factor [Lachnospiraceae bacterium]|nr:response regulator transcription factor [Lachnospiraceae bacterium]
MLRIAVCDDDRQFAAKLENMVRQQAGKMQLNIETESYSDGDALVADIRKGYRYELIFLDIEMEKVNGISAARSIRELDRSVLLIYVSGYEQYLKELFEVEPFRFLSKPVDDSKFQRYFQEACNRIVEDNAFFQFTFNKNICRVELRNIVYFESHGRVIHIILKDRTEECFYGKLNDVEKEMEESSHCFLRIHQSYLVNYSYIKRMSFSDITLTTGQGREITLRISEDREKKVRRQLCGIASGKAGKS